MGFNNPITGGQGALVRPSIHSPNYVTGSTGWTINKDGSAEFNSLNIRGSEVLGDPTVAHIVLNGATGQIQIFDSTGTLVGQLDANGIEFLTGGAIVRMYEGIYTAVTGSLVAGGYLTFLPPTQSGGTFSPGVIGALSFAGSPPGSEMVIASPYQAGQQQAFVYLNSGTDATNGGGVTLQNQGGTKNGNFQSTMDAQFTGTMLLRNPAYIENGPGVFESWHTLTLQNGWTGTMKYRKVACPPNCVQIVSGTMTAGTKTNGTTVATLPAGYRPATGLDVAGTCDNVVAGGQSPHWNIGTGGAIQCQGYTATTFGSINAIIPLDFP